MPRLAQKRDIMAVASSISPLALGREDNVNMLISVSRNLRTPSRTHLENLMNSGFSEGRVDPYLFPARGRKRPGHAHDDVDDWLVVDPYLFPARGRKLSTYSITKLPQTSAALIPTFSPQGDGNTGSDHKYYLSHFIPR